MAYDRLIPANGRVAAAHLQGQVQAETYVSGTESRIKGHPFLLDGPQATRQRQLSHGDFVTVYDRHDNHAFVQSAKDDYCGWIPETALTTDHPPTHRVAVRSTHAFPEPSVQSVPLADLHFGDLVHVYEATKLWATISWPGPAAPSGASEAFVPTQCLCRADRAETDPAEVALRFIGTPYLWAGNSGHGIDCSGLVQAALLACGIPCPGDSDLQARAFPDAGPVTGLQRGDLVFWRGHVGLMLDADRLIHANGFHMAVAVEPLTAAIRRIEATGGGDPTGTGRPD